MNVRWGGSGDLWGHKGCVVKQKLMKTSRLTPTFRLSLSLDMYGLGESRLSWYRYTYAVSRIAIR